MDHAYCLLSYSIGKRGLFHACLSDRELLKHTWRGGGGDGRFRHIQSTNEETEKPLTRLWQSRSAQGCEELFEWNLSSTHCDWGREGGGLDPLWGEVVTVDRCAAGILGRGGGRVTLPHPLSGLLGGEVARLLPWAPARPHFRIVAGDGGGRALLHQRCLMQTYRQTNIQTELS